MFLHNFSNTKLELVFCITYSEEGHRFKSKSHFKFKLCFCLFFKWKYIFYIVLYSKAVIQNVTTLIAWKRSTQEEKQAWKWPVTVDSSFCRFHLQSVVLYQSPCGGWICLLIFVLWIREAKEIRNFLDIGRFNFNFNGQRSITCWNTGWHQLEQKPNPCILHKQNFSIWNLTV